MAALLVKAHEEKRRKYGEVGTWFTVSELTRVVLSAFKFGAVRGFREKLGNLGAFTFLKDPREEEQDVFHFSTPGEEKVRAELKELAELICPLFKQLRQDDREQSSSFKKALLRDP